MQSSLSGLLVTREPQAALRDPAAIHHNGTFYCFHTVVETVGDRFQLSMDVIKSADLKNWTEPRCLAHGPLNFSSPGSLIFSEGRWVLCLQSYPVPPGATYGSEESRLWLMESPDLEQWSEPRLIAPEGSRVHWAQSRRQIDPFLLEHEGKYWCFYKTAGQLGVLVSSDLHHWEEALPERPVFASDQTPDGATIENPCVLRDGEEFVLFFAPCRSGRGIGVARSTDLLNWRDVRYLNFPALPWAPGGPTAPMVLDTRATLGHWTMFFHGDTAGPHGGALGLAFSRDLENWELPEQ